MNPTTLPAWGQLKTHFAQTKQLHLRELFAQDPERFAKFQLEHQGLLVDFSKNRITAETLTLLTQLAEQSGLKEKIEALFTGQKVNFTEDRAALHMALRDPDSFDFAVDGVNVRDVIKSELGRMRGFSEKIRAGEWLGFSGKPINMLVNIGIGGSDLGPAMAAQALTVFGKRDLAVHFVSNVDGADLWETLHFCNPETTLFMVASKTFTTQETLLNAEKAKAWLLEAHAKTGASSDAEAVQKHFVALSANFEKTQEFGIPAENVFQFWDFVGGRYSLWSAIGLSVMCKIGYENFEQLLAGAANIDAHFRNTPFAQNIPVIMALLGIWYRNFFELETQAVLPYSQYLKRLPAYLQQLEMESNGKNTDREGNQITDYTTAPIVWGEPGTNGQHAFYQLLHQGTTIVPADFIGFKKAQHPWPEQHKILLANMIAQSEALAFGAESFSGNRPTTTLLFDELTPFALGQLLAIYEHKVYTQGVIWNINSFDQFGVQLGKKLAKQIEQEVLSNKTQTHDSSTANLISKILSNAT